MTNIVKLQDKDRSRWDNYVLKSQDGIFFHLTGWKESIEKTFALKSIYLMALNECDEVQGVLPLFLVKDLLGKSYLVSIPYSAYAGILANNNQTKQAIFTKAKELALDHKVQYLELRQRGDDTLDLPVKKDFVSMLLKLDRDEESIWQTSLDAKARNQVRKAYKEGLTVDSGKHYLDAFYEILSVNIRDLGSPNYPIGFLKNIIEAFENTSGIIVVRYGKSIIAGMLFVGYKNIFSDPWAASLRQYNTLCPNDILYWEAIKYACLKGYEYFDLGRSTASSGTFNFKKKWGAKPVQLNYQYFLNRAQKIPVVSAHDNKYRAAVNLWKRLPLTIAKPLGSRLIRHLPEL